MYIYTHIYIQKWIFFNVVFKKSWDSHTKESQDIRKQMNQSILTYLHMNKPSLQEDLGSSGFSALPCAFAESVPMTAVAKRCQK